MLGKMKAFAAGLLVGIFVAPRSGRASRQLLMDTLSDFLETGQRRFEELEEDLAERRDGESMDDADWPYVDESSYEGPEPGPGG